MTREISGPVLSMSITLIHASFFSIPSRIPQNCSPPLKDFKGLLTLLSEKLRGFLRTAQTQEGAANKAALFREQVVLAKNDMEFLERRYVCSIYSTCLSITLRQEAQTWTTFHGMLPSVYQNNR